MAEPIIPPELINTLLQQLQQTAQRRPDLIADPRTQRVATYLGRVITPEDTPAEVQRRFPQAELETGGNVSQAMDLLKPGLLAGITKAQLKAGIRPATQIAQIAREGVIPLTATHKLWPAAINETTGEIAHAMQPGAYLHEPLLRSIKNSVRGWVDPVTWNAFTDKMLSLVERK